MDTGACAEQICDRDPLYLGPSGCTRYGKVSGNNWLEGLIAEEGVVE